MPKRKEPVVSSSEKCFWTYAMDECLLDAYIHEQNLGNRVGGTFTSSALDNIVRELKERFPEKNDKIGKQKVKDHMKNLKNKFTPCYDLFKRGLSGFGWNSITNMWEAEPEVWDKLIEANPGASEWRNKPVLFYDKLLALYGQDRATGEHAETGTEMRQRGATLAADSIDDIDRLMSNNEVTLENYDVPNENQQNLNSSPSDATPVRSKKKKCNSGDGALAMFSRSLDNIIEAFSKNTTELIKCNQARPMLEDEVWALLKELSVDNNMFHRAYYFLIRNGDAQRALKGCPPNERKDLLQFLMATNGFPPNS